MPTVIFRPDYAKFLFELPRGLWNLYYRRLNELSHERKFKGEWLKSHKVTALPNNSPDHETTIIEMWGEWTGIVLLLPWDVWATKLRRFDVRTIVWDADQEAVLAVGQRFQRSDIGYNCEVFNSKPASKRLGRDRGGVGFRVGSRKSDLCSVVYKRTGEPVAMEHRLQGQYLRTIVSKVADRYIANDTTVDYWQHTIDLCSSAGQARLNRVFERAGIGTYWPTYRQSGRDDYDQLQTSFAATIEQHADEEAEHQWYLDHYALDALYSDEEP